MTKELRTKNRDFPASRTYARFLDGDFDFPVSKSFAEFLAARDKVVERNTVDELRRQILDLQGEILVLRKILGETGDADANG